MGGGFSAKVLSTTSKQPSEKVNYVLHFTGMNGETLI
jgi:hypothetical protein